MSADFQLSRGKDHYKKKYKKQNRELVTQFFYSFFVTLPSIVTYAVFVMKATQTKKHRVTLGKFFLKKGVGGLTDAGISVIIAG